MNELMMEMVHDYYIYEKIVIHNRMLWTTKTPIILDGGVMLSLSEYDASVFAVEVVRCHYRLLDW